MFKNKISEYKIKSIHHKIINAKNATNKNQRSFEEKSSAKNIDTNRTNGSMIMN
jgi:hypothetical protein